MDPITGALLLTYGFGKVYKGILAEGFDATKMKRAVNDIFDAKVALIERSNILSLNKASQQRGVGLKSLSLKTGQQYQGIQDTSSKMASKANMATSGTLDTIIQRNKTSLWDAYQNSQNNINDTFKFATEQAAIQKAYSLAEAQREKQEKLAEIEMIPSNFFEGVFS